MKKVAESHLTHREEAALRTHLRSGDPPLSPTLSAQIFELYLKGSTLEQIARVNKGLRLGAIVRAAEEGDFYGRRKLYLEGLYDGVRGKVQQAVAEAADFTSDYLAVCYKLHGDKFKLYLQSGNEADLGDMKPTSIRQFQVMFDLLLKMSGSDNNKRVTGKIEHTHTVAATGGDTAPAPASRFTPEQAMQVLMAMAEGEVEK